MKLLAALWPRSRIRSVTGAIGTDDPTDLVAYLQKALEFQNIVPGAHAEMPGISSPAVGISADVIVKNPLDPLEIRPLVLTQMPDIAFFLIDTPVANPVASPARLFVTHRETGIDLIIEGIPVEIRVPTDLLGPLRSLEEDNANPTGGPDVTLTDIFQPGVYDSFQVTLRDTDYSSIYVHLRLRMTEEMDFIIEPSVPISIGPCRFTGLPCRGLHDLNFIPSPKLQRDQTLEWTRHRIDRLPVDSDHSGVITIRTVDLDPSREPLKELADKMNEDRSPNDLVEFVLEDIALPLSSIVSLPIPSHGTFGLRRKIEIGDSLDQAFGLSRSPVQIKLGDWRLHIDQLLLRTPASLDPLDQFIFVQMALLFGSDPGETHAATLSVTDEWTIQAGWRPPTIWDTTFDIAGCSITLVGLKIGWSLKRFTSKSPSYKAKDQFQILGDFNLHTRSTSTSIFGKDIFRMRSLSGKDVDVVIRDIGYSFGEATFGKGLSFPEGVQLVAFGVIRLVVEEVGWVAENNGARYISFSGGIYLFPGAGQEIGKAPTGSTNADSEDDASSRKLAPGLTFLRLRFRTGGNSNAPLILLDGVSLFLRIGKFQILGFGMYSRFTEGDHEYTEFGIGLQVKFHALEKDFLIGMAAVLWKGKGPDG